jgi:hypothetical protein
MSDNTSKHRWIGLVVTVGIAFAGWGIVLVDKLQVSERAAITQEIASERSERITADSTIDSTLGKVVENTKDVPALVAEMKIVLSRLGLDDK